MIDSIFTRSAWDMASIYTDIQRYTSFYPLPRVSTNTDNNFNIISFEA